MSYQLTKTVSFGSGKAGLSTVGYTLLNADGSINTPRSTSGVIELGGGQYAAPVTFPDSFRGFVKWDTGEGSPAYAGEEINPQTGEYAALIKAKTDLITAGQITVSANVTKSGNRVIARRGTTVAVSFTGLGSLAGRTALYFTAKKKESQGDASAIYQIEEGAGLLVLNGADVSASRPSEGSVVVTDQAAGDVTATLAATAAAELLVGTDFFYDLKVILPASVEERVRGPLDIVADITRAVN